MENKEDQIRVAKLVIVGWIKNWNCITLFSAITGKFEFSEDDIQETYNKYKFLPQQTFWYKTTNGAYIKQYVKRYISDLNTKLSNALWDTKDNVKKLAFAEFLITLDSKNITVSKKYNKPDASTHAKENRAYKSNMMARSQIKEFNQKMNNTHWGSVK